MEEKTLFSNFDIQIESSGIIISQEGNKIKVTLLGSGDDEGTNVTFTCCMPEERK